MHRCRCKRNNSLGSNNPQKTKSTTPVSLQTLSFPHLLIRGHIFITKNASQMVVDGKKRKCRTYVHHKNAGLRVTIYRALWSTNIRSMSFFGIGDSSPLISHFILHPSRARLECGVLESKLSLFYHNGLPGLKDLGQGHDRRAEASEKIPSNQMDCRSTPTIQNHSYRKVIHHLYTRH
jgi:hypothetical protein